jgi:hypothetical protein
VSGCYRFTTAAGDVFTLYDWKATALYYGEEEGWPSRDEFWADPEPVELNIGDLGEENEDGLNLGATAFREWLLERYRGHGSELAN